MFATPCGQLIDLVWKASSTMVTTKAVWGTSFIPKLLCRPPPARNGCVRPTSHTPRQKGTPISTAGESSSSPRWLNAILKPFRAVTRLVDSFLLLILSAVLIASLWPVQGQTAHVLNMVLWWGVALLFFLYGVRLPTRDAIDAIRSWQLHSSVLAASFVFFPILGVLGYVITRNFLPESLAWGILFLSLLPSTVQSSITFTSIARGNVAAAVVASSLSNVLGMVVTPLLVALTMGGALQVQGRSLVGIATQLLVPFALGQVLRRYLAPAILAHPRWTRVSDRSVIVLVVYLAFSEAVVGGIWSELDTSDIAILVLACALILTAVLVGTAWWGRRLGLSVADQIVLVMCGSKKSLTTGVPMATVLLPAASLGMMLLPLMLFHQIQLLVCAVIARRWGERTDA